MEDEEQECKQERRPLEVEYSSPQSSAGPLSQTLSKEIVSVGVETDQMNDLVTRAFEAEKVELENKLQDLTSLFDLSQNVAASFAGVIRGTCEPARFLEYAYLLESTDPLQHEFIDLLKETLNRQAQKSLPSNKNTSSVSTQSVQVLQCCAETLTDKTAHQDLSCQTTIKCEVTAGASDRTCETYSSEHCQTDFRVVCQQCLVIVQFMSQCCDTLRTGVLSVDHARVLQQLDQMPADSVTALQLRNIVSNFSSLFLQKIEKLGQDMGSPASTLADRDEFNAMARATSDALSSPDPDAALAESQQQLQTMQPPDAVVTCMRQLLSAHVALRGQYKQAEQDKLALATLVRTKHAESEAYHAKLQTLLTERQANAQLADAEERLATQVEFISSAEDLITSAREERDAARSAGRASQSELNGLKTSYANLQKALENLEKGGEPSVGFLVFLVSDASSLSLWRITRRMKRRPRSSA
ncbi:unnamed protein product [Dibothriocephalus latus]|uniref:Uncharacterized protein n=1 Tax=Dibothriocephalus latus TaxID=60516 RepID=A0A3P7L970_DIBLA|nr:unnamed protein product [Dibothriocephalus latus]